MEQLDNAQHRSEFYRMWLAAFAAGFTHSKSMETMGVRSSAQTEETRRWILNGTSRGRDLTELVDTGGSRFDDFERALIGLGEETGRLEEVLRQLADFYARKHKLMLWVKKKMGHPFFKTAYLTAALSGVVVLFLSAQTILAAVAARRESRCRAPCDSPPALPPMMRFNVSSVQSMSDVWPHHR